MKRESQINRVNQKSQKNSRTTANKIKGLVFAASSMLAVMATGLSLNACSSHTTPAETKSALMNMSAKEAYDLSEYAKKTLKHQAYECINPQTRVSFPDEIYADVIKRCQPTFKKLESYLAENGISGVDNNMLMDQAVLNSIAKKYIGYSMMHAK